LFNSSASIFIEDISKEGFQFDTKQSNLSFVENCQRDEIRNSLEEVISLSLVVILYKQKYSTTLFFLNFGLTLFIPFFGWTNRNFRFAPKNFFLFLLRGGKVVNGISDFPGGNYNLRFAENKNNLKLKKLKYYYIVSSKIETLS